MRLFLFAAVFLAVSSHSVFAQGLDYADAPKTFLTYAMGASAEDVVNQLKAAKTNFTQKGVAASAAQQQILIPHQTMATWTDVLVTLSFASDRLYQVSASLPFDQGSWTSLISQYSTQLGQAKSYDGGFTYYWFYFQKDHSSGQVPDFAVVLNGDSLTSRKITISYVDNTIKLAPTPATATAAATAPAPTPAVKAP